LREHYDRIVGAPLCNITLEPGACFLDCLGGIIFPEGVVGGGVEEVDSRCGGGGVAAVYEVEVDVEVGEVRAEACWREGLVANLRTADKQGRGRLRTRLGVEYGAAGALAVEA
jgi:hypothetical protein